MAFEGSPSFELKKLKNAMIESSLNLIENIAVVILICIVSIFISNASVGIALLVGALLTIIEMAIIFTNVMWVEKTNISKSLKGGCL